MAGIEQLTRWQPTRSSAAVGPAVAPPAGAAPPLDPKRWLALAVIGISQLMVILDATIVNIALPQAQADLGITDADRQWMVTAYTLPFGALLLLGGRIADYVGRKRILIIVAVRLRHRLRDRRRRARPAGMLFGARALQGAFAAMLAPAALSLVTVTFTDAKERAKAFAVFGAIAGGGAAIGLLLGGVLTEYASWRWCLFVNIPIAIVAVLRWRSRCCGNRRWRATPTTTSRARCWPPRASARWSGAAPSPPSTAGARSTRSAGWPSSVVLLIAFVLVELRSTSPLLPLRIVENRNRAGAYLVGLLVGAGLFAIFLFLTYYLQGVLRYTPIQAGFAFLPFSAGVVIGAGIGSQLTIRVGPRVRGARRPAARRWSGCSGSPGSAWRPTYFGTILPAMLMIAVGMGFIFMSTTNLALVGVNHDDAGVASAVVNTTQQVGGSIGTALLNTIAATATASFLVSNPPHGADPRKRSGPPCRVRRCTASASRSCGRRSSSVSPSWRRWC